MYVREYPLNIIPYHKQLISLATELQTIKFNFKGIKTQTTHLLTFNYVVYILM